MLETFTPNIDEPVYPEGFKPKDSWPVRYRANNRAPVGIGYVVDPEDDLRMVPDWDIIKILQQGLDYVDDGSSYREVADWLEVQLGRSISHQTVSNWWRDKRLDSKSPRAKAIRARDRKANAGKLPRDRAKTAQVRKVAAAKRSLTAQQKKLDGYNEDRSAEVEFVTNDTFVGGFEPSDIEPEPLNTPIFSPNEGPQTDFLSAIEQEVLYGGAAGGGKSYALLADPVRYFHNPNFRGIIFRRTNDELRELKFKAQELYIKAFPDAKWKEKDSEFVFPSGARLWFTYLERDDDVLRYQGQAFTYVAFDELTQYPTPFAWDYMRTRLRDASKTLPLFMRATTNPGGPGHGWVKRMFIDPIAPNKPFWARNIDTGEVLVWPEKQRDGSPHPRAGQPLFQRRFIPASLYDNPYLAEDGQYEANLMSQGENKRRQLLEGDWTVADGAAFSEFRTINHVIEPFTIPHDWKRFRSCDYGYASHSAVLWYAVEPAFDQLIVYRELYVSKKTGADLAQLVLEAERGERIAYGVLDSSVWHKRGQMGPSIAEEMINAGCKWQPSDRSDGSRVSGKNRLHELLKVDEETNMPGIVIFDTCRQLISDLPVIPTDPNGGDDIDKRYASDHTYDSLRYGIQSRPRSSSPFDTFGTVSKYSSSYRPSDTTFGY